MGLRIRHIQAATQELCSTPVFITDTASSECLSIHAAGIDQSARSLHLTLGGPESRAVLGWCCSWRLYVSLYVSLASWFRGTDGGRRWSDCGERAQSCVKDGKTALVLAAAGEKREKKNPGSEHAAQVAKPKTGIGRERCRGTLELMVL